MAVPFGVMVYVTLRPHRSRSRDVSVEFRPVHLGEVSQHSNDS